MPKTSPSLQEAIRALEAGTTFGDIPPVKDADKRLREVAELVVKDHEKLDMGCWFGCSNEPREPSADFAKIAHTCGTTACIAGWALLLAGDDGKALLLALNNQHIDEPEDVAGFILLGGEAANHFYDEDDEALEFLQGVLEKG